MHPLPSSTLMFCLVEADIFGFVFPVCPWTWVDMNVMELIVVCMEHTHHPHTYSVELQVCDIAYPLTKAITETFIAHRSPVGAMGWLALAAI